MATRPPVSIEVDGLRKLRADLKRMGDDLADVKDANQRAGQLVAGEAEQRAPRRTGTLAGSGRASRSASRATVMFGGARVPYAGPVHYGWPAHNIDPQPFVVEAAQATEHEWLPLYEDEIARAVDKVAGKTY